MNKLFLPKFNHKVTLLGGQSFSWDLTGPTTYTGFTQHRAIRAKFEGDYMYWQTYPQKNDFEFIKQYFRLDVDYDAILSAISKDPYVSQAIAHIPNIRLLSQPFELTVLSFIISANNNIFSIRKSIRSLAKMFGDKVYIGQDEYVHLFPKTTVLANLDIEELRKTGVGFRAKYIKNSANQLLQTNLGNLAKDIDENQLRTKLLDLYGVGDKIADCVIAFSASYDNVTPIDIWIKRVLINLYGLPNNWKYNQYRKWMKNNFSGYAAWSAQFLFEWYRKTRKS